ncbi:MAG: penicillin-binding protein 1C [Deltaproteobacteria bacterium]|nr:penicillin-binding protein 1C [Deltaproteobacteria bacterium]
MKGQFWRVILLLAIAGVITWFLYSFFSFPSYKTFKFEYLKLSDGVVLDRNNYPLSVVRQDFETRRVAYIKLCDVNSRFLELLVKSEDKRFYHHSGVDFISILSAIKDFIETGRQRGASTINMQFARNYFKLRKEGKLIRKIKEILYALIIDLKWEKEEILEAYINTVPIRSEISGIYTASYGLFNKSPEYLNEVESLILLSLIRGPSLSGEEIVRIAKRINKNLNLGIEESKITQKILEIPQQGYHNINYYNYLPVLSERLLRRHKSPIVTTIDIGIQKKAFEIVRSFVLEMKERNLNDAALIVVENKTGEILAYIPNSYHLSSNRYVDGVIARRQAGSTLKPFLYEFALGQRLITPASIIEDTPLFIGKGGPIYSPKNYDRSYKGLVSMRNALASSLNIPAVRVIAMVGVENYTYHLRNLGFNVDRSNEIDDYYGESLALGTLDVSLYELVRAYVTLANSGIFQDLKILVRENKERKPVLDRRTVYIIQNILSDRDARSLTFDLENTLSTPFYSAVKTGTSKDMRDNWCVGFSEKYTVGVWTGNFSGEPMYNVSGSHGASQIWFALIKELHKKTGSRPPPLPEGIIKKRIRYVPPLEPERDELFLKDTEPDSGEILISYDKIPKIIYPPNGSIFALDPEVPSSQQKLYVYTNCNDCTLMCDNQEVRGKNNVYIVDIKRGYHSLVLLDVYGNTLDSIKYEVR